MSQSSSSTGGVSFFGLLALLFIGLKLGGVIDWSWWLVLLPLYGPPVVLIWVFFFALTVYGIAVLLEKVK